MSRQSRRLLTSAALGIVASLWVVTAATFGATVKPLYDLSGEWALSTDPNVTGDIFQEGTEVRAIFFASDDAGLYSHYIDARYYSPRTFEGVIARIHVGCTTEARWTVTVSDNAHFSTKGVALDSSCDVVKGTVVISNWVRVK